MADLPDPLPYRVLTGHDDRLFCERVSHAMLEGYQLHGPPTMAVQDGRIVIAQAMVLPSAAAAGAGAAVEAVA